MAERIPAHMLRMATILDRQPQLLEEAKRLARLERQGWRVRNRELIEACIPTMSKQGFRSIPSWMPQDPMDVNATTIAAAADTVLWDATKWTAIPANTIGAGDTFKVTAWGVTTTAVTGSQTLIATPRFGTTTSGASLGASKTQPVNAAVQTNVPFDLEMWVHFRQRGASGLATCGGRMNAVTIIGTAATTNTAPLQFGTGSTTATTVDTTAASGLVVSLTPSLATQTFTCLGVIPELLN
jgi:hypothetical protein